MSLYKRFRHQQNLLFKPKYEEVYFYPFLWLLILKSDIAGLQNEDGSFSGDIWGEVDMRYSFPFCFVILLLTVLGVSYLCKQKFYKNNSFSYRFSYIAICCLSILHRLSKINVEKAVSYILSCKNLEGGFGCTPGGESHVGQSMLYINLQSLYEVFTF